MTGWSSDCCYCILQIPDNPYDESRAKFIQQCVIHNTPQQTFIHCRNFSFRFGNTTNKSELELIGIEKAVEKIRVRNLGRIR